MNCLTFRQVALLLMLLLACINTASAEEKDAERERLHKIVFTYFDGDDEQGFYKAISDYRNYVKDKGNDYDFWNTYSNEIIYDINHDHYYVALKKTEELERDMERAGAAKYRFIINYLMGVFYGTRDNNDLCKEYLKKALTEIDTVEHRTDMVAMYQMLTNICIFVDGEEGLKWGDKAVNASEDNYQLCGSLGVKAMVAFAHNEQEIFDDCYRRIEQIRQESADDFYPIYQPYIEMGRYTFDHEYDKAIAMTDSLQSESERLSFLAVIYSRKGDLQKENETLKQLLNAKEHRNNEISTLTINDINNDIEISHERLQRRRAELYTIIAIFVFLGFVILSLLYLIWSRRKHMAQMMAQNLELEKARDHAEESDRMKTAFIRNVSHQIRTPLNAISGFSQILTTQIDELADDERLDLAERIDHNTSVITTSLNHLISLSEVESTHLSETAEPINCNQFCEEIIHDFKPKNELLTVEYTSQLSNHISVVTNKKMLRNVLTELLFNADKFAKEGKIVMDSSQEGDMWKICVTDTGVGIPEEKRDDIFGMFTKVDDFTEGLGLGLTFCKTIALQLGGGITLDKDYHDGARFIITIPLH